MIDRERPRLKCTTFIAEGDPCRHNIGIITYYYSLIPTKVEISRRQGCKHTVALVVATLPAPTESPFPTGLGIGITYPAALPPSGKRKISR